MVPRRNPAPSSRSGPPVNDLARCAGKRRPVGAPAAKTAAVPKYKSISPTARARKPTEKEPAAEKPAEEEPAAEKPAEEEKRRPAARAAKTAAVPNRKSIALAARARKPEEKEPAAEKPAEEEKRRLDAAPAAKPKSIAPAARAPTGNPIEQRPRWRMFGTNMSSNAPAAKPSKVLQPLKKKPAVSADLESKAQKRSPRVSFQVPAVEVAAPGSGAKGQASADDVAGHTPVVPMKAADKAAQAVGAETPFFSACSSFILDQLESAAYWLAQIRLAEDVGRHRVAAAFFRLAFECQAQPIHKIQRELRDYTVRHETAGTSTPLFDELLTAHGMPVNQPKFDIDGIEKV